MLRSTGTSVRAVVQPRQRAQAGNDVGKGRPLPGILLPAVPAAGSIWYRKGNWWPGARAGILPGMWRRVQRCEHIHGHPHRISWMYASRPPKVSAPGPGSSARVGMGGRSQRSTACHTCGHRADRRVCRAQGEHGAGHISAGAAGYHIDPRALFARLSKHSTPKPMCLQHPGPTSKAVLPSQGRRQTSISYSTRPKEKTSEAAVARPPSRISGACRTCGARRPGTVM